MEMRNISRRRSRSSDYAELGHSQRMAKKCSKTYNARAIEPFVWWRSRCRRRHGLLKFPIKQLRTPVRLLPIVVILLKFG